MYNRGTIIIIKRTKISISLPNFPHTPWYSFPTNPHVQCPLHSQATTDLLPWGEVGSSAPRVQERIKFKEFNSAKN